MKEKESYFNYTWTCAEIGKIKREIREQVRLLKILEDTKKVYENKIRKSNKK